MRDLSALNERHNPTDEQNQTEGCRVANRDNSRTNRRLLTRLVWRRSGQDGRIVRRQQKNTNDSAEDQRKDQETPSRAQAVRPEKYFVALGFGWRRRR